MRIETATITTNYELSGPKNAPVVMLSHSLGSNLHMWDPQMTALEAKYQVLRYDTRGHGASDAPVGAYTLDQLVSDAVALMDALGIKKVNFVGLSMGGILSLLMSTRLTVQGVVAMSTPYKLPDDPRLRKIDWIAKIVTYMPKSDEAPGASWFDKEAFKEHISYPMNPVRSIGQLNQLLGEMRVALPKINVPVLLMHSKDDKYVSPENIELIFADLKNASDKTKLFVTGSGHVVTRDAARRQVFEAALEFIQRVENRVES